MANSLLEALAFGKPVLAADIDGNRSIIRDGVTGLLYGNSAEFREKAHELLSDAALREKLGGEGRRLVLDSFPADKEAAAYLDLYREILGRGARGTEAGCRTRGAKAEKIEAAPT